MDNTIKRRKNGEPKKSGGARPGSGAKKIPVGLKTVSIALYINGVQFHNYFPVDYVEAVGKKAIEIGVYDLDSNPAAAGREVLREFIKNSVFKVILKKA